MNKESQELIYLLSHLPQQQQTYLCNNMIMSLTELVNSLDAESEYTQNYMNVWREIDDYLFIEDKVI